jgi:CSLREA domain-containing protein
LIWRRNALAATAAVVATFASLAVASSAVAASIVVDTNSDDASGTTGSCSLREAIINANTDADNTNGCAQGSGTDDISFVSTLDDATISLTNGELQIQSPLNIVGGTSNVTIGGATGSRVIDINSGSPVVQISGITVQDGDLGIADSQRGGGIYNPGNGALTLTDVTVKNNSVSAASDGSGDAIAQGGGIFSAGPLFLNQSVISDNTATAHNTDSSNTGSVAEGGGVLGGTMTITDSTISGNVIHGIDDHDSGGPTHSLVDPQGGGIKAQNLTMQRSTVSGNQALGDAVDGGSRPFGGGIYLFGTSSDIQLSTVAGNQVGGSGGFFIQLAGGGILDSGGDMALTSDTIALNGPVDASSMDGANLQANPDYTAVNTILSDPRGGGANCNGAGTATSDGFNVDYSPGGASCGFTGFGTLTSDPKLDTGGLADNGSLTETIALQATSPVIDQGTNTAQTEDFYDQRGLFRPVDAPAIGSPVGGNGTDIGAFEAQAPAAPDVTGTDPDSPTFNDVSPEVVGTTTDVLSSAEAPTSVTIFSDSGCVTQVSPDPDSPTVFSTTGITALLSPNTTTTLYANASNDYGISSPCSTSFATYTVDSLGPVMTIDSGPSDPTDHTPTFTFHGTDVSPPITYECSVDAAAFSPCTSPFTSSSLGDGSHTFRVQGADSLDTGGAPASQSFTITTPAPPVTTTTTTPTTPTPPVTTPAPKKKKCKKAKKGSASAAKKCKKHKK